MAEILHAAPLVLAVPLVHGHWLQQVAKLLGCSQQAILGFEVGVWVDEPHLWLEDVSVALLGPQALGEASQIFTNVELIS